MTTTTDSKTFKLIFVKPNGKNERGEYQYILLFSENSEEAWGNDWDDNNPSTAKSGDLTPSPYSYSLVKKFTSEYPFRTIQETSCYSMEYAIIDAIALAWIDIENLDVYPKEGRCVLHFGDTVKTIEDKLEPFDYILEEETL